MGFPHLSLAWGQRRTSPEVTLARAPALGTVQREAPNRGATTTIEGAGTLLATCQRQGDMKRDEEEAAGEGWDAGIVQGMHAFAFHGMRQAAKAL